MGLTRERTARTAATLGACLAIMGLIAACAGDEAAPERSDEWSGASPSPSRGPRAGLIVFDGDSLTEGYFLAPSQSYPSQAMRRLPDWLRHANVAVSGQTWPDLLSDVHQEVDPFFSESLDIDLVVVWAGANDLAAGYSAREALENAWRYCESRRRVGFQVVTATLYPLQPKNLDAGYEERRRKYNDLLRAEWREFADALVDVAADERIGDSSGPARRRYFIDAVHLNEEGYGVIADCFLPALQRMVKDAAR
jgi:lysophospholipase L1-like esterase